MDAARYQPAPPRRPGTKGRPPTKGRRLPNLAEVLAAATTRWQRVSVPGWYGPNERVVEFCSATAVWRHAGRPIVPLRGVLLRDPQDRFEPQARLCTEPAREPWPIVRWFIQRWQLEVTCREVRDHLGVETQRQWSDRAIARTTPCLLGLFSLVTLRVTRLGRQARLAVPAESWYRKPHPTFIDALAAVRRQIWRESGFVMSRRSHETLQLPAALQQCLIDALCRAA